MVRVIWECVSTENHHRSCQVCHPAFGTNYSFHWSRSPLVALMTRLASLPTVHRLDPYLILRRYCRRGWRCTIRSYVVVWTLHYPLPRGARGRVVRLLFGVRISGIWNRRWREHGQPALDILLGTLTIPHIGCSTGTPPQPATDQVPHKSRTATCESKPGPLNKTSCIPNSITRCFNAGKLVIDAPDDVRHGETASVLR
jgi:hypothetical protein